MTATISEVQEIIKNLESNSEISIKEEKYLKVAKLCVQLAAENVALKQAESNLVRNIINDLGDTEFQYARVQTPATDRIVAGIKADGVEEFVSNTVHKIFDESEAVSALAYISLANSHVNQLREGADK